MENEDVSLLKKLTTDQLIERLLHLKDIHDKDAKDFEEYKTTSQEMELMMEREIEDAHRKVRSTAAKLQQLEVDAERAQNKNEAEKREFLRIEEALRQEVNRLRTEQENNRVRIRELEQRNDDLERHERNNQQEVADLERKVNEMTERLTLLENELAEKQTTAEEMYRLREEMRVADRPLLMVGPLRAERAEEDTPEEPTHENRRKHQGFTTSTVSSLQLDRKSNGLSYANAVNREPSDKENAQVLESPLPSCEGRSFANCVNRIVKDLIVKVDRLENILTGLRVHSVRR